MSEHDQNTGAVIIDFPKPKDTPDRPRTTVERASLAEVGRRDELIKILAPRLTSNTQMRWEDRLVLARNLRDYLGRLEAAGRLDVKKLADRVFGRPLGKALQEYRLPKGIEDLAQFRSRYPNRHLAGKPVRYHQIVVEAAKQAGTDERQAVIELARGSSHWPGAEDVGDEERRAANEVAEVLRLLRLPLDEVHPLDGYFDVIERHRILPVGDGDSLAFKQLDEFEWWVQDAFPAVTLATRWLKTDPQAVVVVVSDNAAGKRLPDAEFDRLYEHHRFFESTVSTRQVFSLGIGRLENGTGPVGIYRHEVVVSSRNGHTVVRQSKADRLGPGWNCVDIKVGGQVVQGAWQLMDALLNPPDEEDAYVDYDERRDVTIIPLTADWLLDTRERGWMITRSIGTGELWPVVANFRDSRLGHEDTLPAIIERCLLADGEKWGPVKELREHYHVVSAALRKWVATTDEKNRATLERMVTRLTTGASSEIATEVPEMPES
ncbi:hypothetical protein AFCDBAGC_1954 [Methylobacterium cerastii]|uniref:Uncharacterized protein n=1 Tax=Methylobacterium cerastii TaxID=932741 RepID=A0ABQ4QH55_9HYPH|nr:hypothetical protein [Methylobacterium cerastii]GJD44091.1 hypothetical protein AFCDBAGC_1954 [Methylobacterium cerastii]